MQRRNKGFTLVELLVVMAIIAIMGSITTIAVWRYNRKMTQIEYDGIAKEIFMAAQNHLTMAEEQGYLGYSETAFGSEGNILPDEKGIYYFVVNDFPAKSSVLDQMLPFGSIDDTVRKGNYIIRYQKSPARVLDVFYSGTGGKYGHNYSNDEYSSLVVNYRGSDKKTQRRMDNDYIIGWYGGEEAETIEHVDLSAPSIKLVNDEQLYLELTNPNTGKLTSDYALRIIVEGNSGGKVFLTIKDLYKTAGCEKLYIVLDDISENGMHFKDIFSNSNPLPFEAMYTIEGNRNLIPGEDITVYATAFSTTKLSGVKNSTKATVNSLFDNVTSETAVITKVRHLENLGTTVSGYNNTYPKAIQKSNLDWIKFKNKVNQLKKMENTFYNHDVSTEKVFYTGEVSDNGSLIESTKPGTYAPIQTGTITYDGDKHTISNVTIDSTIPSGLFSELENSSVANLKLIDFNVKSTSDAGSLTGSMENSNIDNIVSYFTKSGMIEGVNAGGLVGIMNGGTIIRSGAALTVTGKNAGGLIGTAEDATVRQCYSGGQTENGRYSATNYNVTATDNAGGLVGNAMGDFSKCYSTCSASGSKAGGFAGSLTGSAVNCYAMGLASWPFSETTANIENCYYLGMVNENALGDTNGKAKSISSAIGEISVNDVWNSFTQYPEIRNAVPYDNALKKYSGKYLYRTVFQLEKMAPGELTDESVKEENYFAEIHYGDWPSMETEIVNEKN